MGIVEIVQSLWAIPTVQWMIIGAVLYVFKPEVITRIFQKLEDLVNGIKFTVLGKKIDFSTFEWDDKINHFLRDLAINKRDDALAIKSAVSNNEITSDEGKKKLYALTDDVVSEFMEHMPEDVLSDLVGLWGDKAKVALVLAMRVRTIVHDIKHGTEPAKKN